MSNIIFSIYTEYFRSVGLMIFLLMKMSENERLKIIYYLLLLLLFIHLVQFNMLCKQRPSHVPLAF